MTFPVLFLCEQRKRTKKKNFRGGILGACPFQRNNSESSASVSANGVAEEILYRGFLCKRLCGKTGIVGGIILQAVLFGLMHNILYMAAGLDVGLWYHTLTFMNNEKALEAASYDCRQLRHTASKEALIKAGKGEVSSQKRRKCQGKERIEGRNPWNSYTSQLKGRKSPMRVGVNRPLWQAYTDLRWRRARVIG